MHNIRTNFSKFYSICKELFEKEVNSRHNFQCYPVAPKMNDLQIVALSCCMEALGIDSENLLWSKLKTDYANQFTNLIDRSRFNRRKRMAEMTKRVQHHVGQRLDHLSNTMIVDSVPVPVIKMVRERSFKSFKHDFETAPAKGYSAVNKNWFIGYKLHVIIFLFELRLIFLPVFSRFYHWRSPLRRSVDFSYNIGRCCKGGFKKKAW